MNTARQTNTKVAMPLGKQRNYNEVVEYLDNHWSVQRVQSLDLMKRLDQALGNPSQKVNTILVGGTNGKSLTIYFTARLLKEEGIKVGTYSAPHILTYNERFTVDQEAISNKLFTELGNEVITALEACALQAHSSEILAMMALLYFVQQKVEVALLEAGQGSYDPANICHARVATVTRVTSDSINQSEEDVTAQIADAMGIVKKGTYLVSGDQSKMHLQIMQNLTAQQGAEWAMPIRKLAVLPYPFEQLHGRCAALAERVAQMYVTHYVSRTTSMLSGNLLNKQKGQRGRPTLEAKRNLELNPQKTLEQFWKETYSELPGRFQLLDKEKPSILLDNACNIDAFKNLLLGIRLLHYKRPLKGLTIIIGAASHTLHNEEFIKLLRYFFKKTSGQLLLCPISKALPGTGEDVSWDVEQVTNDIKGMKVKAKACANFEEAFEYAKKSVDERQGLVVITGSQSIVSEYWTLKGIKRF